MATWTAKANKGEVGGYEKAPPGNHPAVLVGIIDLGDQWKEPFSNKPDPKTGKVDKARWTRQLYFVYELVTKKKSAQDANHLMAIDLTLSMNEKAKMRKWIEARTGKTIPDGSDYDVGEELGQPVLLSVVMKGDYPKIDNVTGVPDGFTVPSPKTKPVAWALDANKIDDIPDWVPYLYGESIRDVVRRCRQVAGDKPTPRPVKQTVGAVGDDGDTPF